MYLIPSSHRRSTRDISAKQCRCLVQHFRETSLWDSIAQTLGLPQLIDFNLFFNFDTSCLHITTYSLLFKNFRLSISLAYPTSCLEVPHSTRLMLLTQPFQWQTSSSDRASFTAHMDNDRRSSSFRSHLLLRITHLDHSNRYSCPVCSVIQNRSRSSVMSLAQDRATFFVLEIGGAFRGTFRAHIYPSSSYFARWGASI
jgi:hypothetical protein